MNYEAAIELAKQRMREIGKSPDEYHIEAVTIVGTAQERLTGKITFKAFNQYYFLVNDEDYRGLEIISDTGYFNSNDHSNDTRQEFSGQIIINKLDPLGTWTIETIGDFTGPVQAPLKFIRVTIF